MEVVLLEEMEVEEEARFSLFREDWDAARRVCMCEDGTGEDAMWYGPKVTWARRDSAIVCSSLGVYSARFRLDEERVPYGVLGERVDVVAEEGLASPRASPEGGGIVKLSPERGFDSFVVVELERDMAVGA